MRAKKKGTYLKRNTYVLVRLFPEEKELCRQLAIQEKLNFSELFRSLLREKGRERGIWK